MAKIELPHVQSFKDRHGKRRFYYRRAGYQRVSLPGLPGSKEFMAAYQAAQGDKAEIGADKTLHRSISALIVAYYQTQAFTSLKPQTQTNYRNVLDRFRKEHGDGSALTIKTRHLETIFDQMSGPAAMRVLRKRLRAVFRLGVRLEWRSDNPVTETEIPKHRSVGFIPWSEEDIKTYRAFWPSGTRQRLALELLLNTLARRSDARTLGRQHAIAGGLRWTQEKTGKQVWVPVLPELAAEIATAAPGMTFLVTQYGAPFTHAGFTNWFVESAKAAGLKNRTPHGLRKAGGRRLAEAGCSAKQIAAALGHSSTKEAETYTKDADQALLSGAAFANLSGTPAVKPDLQGLQKPPQSLIVQGVAKEGGRPGGSDLAERFQARRLSNRQTRRR